MFYGWSWIIPEKIHKNFLCLALHPSKLPFFKGGSPLQNQIMKGHFNSAVSVFRINNRIDGGDIFFQKKLNLKKSIPAIFKDLTKKGYLITNSFLNNFVKGNVIFKKQRKKGSFYKRRNPSMSEFKIDEIKKIKFEKFENFVRALNDPYPNAFFCTKNYEIKVKSVKKVRKNSKLICLNDKKNIPKSINGEFIELKDSLAKIIKGSIVRKN